MGDTITYTFPGWYSGFVAEITDSPLILLSPMGPGMVIKPDGCSLSYTILQFALVPGACAPPQKK